MSNGKDEHHHFELEPDDGVDLRPKPPQAVPDEPRQPGEAEVDTRTVAERAGKAVERHRDAVPLPEDWPRDAFVFPLRKPGLRNIATGAVVILLLDVLAVNEAGRFPSWILKLVVLMFLLRGQLHVIGRSAAGHDDPSGWREALRVDSDELKKYGGFMVFFALGMAPGWLLIAFDWVKAGIAVLAVGSMYASIVALGAALEDPSLKWPWKAAYWMFRHPVGSIAGSAGWWVLGLSEVALVQVYPSGVAVTLIVAVPLRALAMYAIALSARAVGVMGRSWTG